jgi:hypothetical protein
MKFVQDHLYAKPEAAARRLLEIERHRRTAAFMPFPARGGSPDEYRAGIEHLRADGLIEMHDSGAFFRLTAGAALCLAGPSASSTLTNES